MGISAATLPIGFHFTSPAFSVLSSPTRITINLCSHTKPKVSLFVRDERIQKWRKNRRLCRCSGSPTASEHSVSLMSKAAEISDALKGASMFIVGMKCALKSQTAKILAEALRYCYFDSDSLVAQAAGGEIDVESLRKEDPSGFDKSETEVLKQLSSMRRLVVCAGDGAVQGIKNLSYLRYGVSVWIDIPLNMLEVEDNNNAKRPSLDSYSKRYKEHKDGYAIADVRISLEEVAFQHGYDDLNAVTSEDLIFEILKLIGKQVRMKKMMEDAAKPF
ncbi:Shikimate kinase [Zostera marina]|uniref:Shikimate kinase n=1 Tax=Zostera marina TaxID=29655 RepID=A0A0K9NQ86_ZOSMR|nr:Shikimate kinase [Zostera marina]